MLLSRIFTKALMTSTSFCVCPVQLTQSAMSSSCAGRSNFGFCNHTSSRADTSSRTYKPSELYISKSSFFSKIILIVHKKFSILLKIFIVLINSYFYHLKYVTMERQSYTATVNYILCSQRVNIISLNLLNSKLLMIS